MNTFFPTMSELKQKELAVKCRRAGLHFERNWLNVYPYHLRNALQAKRHPILLCSDDRFPYWVDVYKDSLMEPFAMYADGTLEDARYCRIPAKANGTLQVVIDGLVAFISIEGNVLLNLLSPGTPEIEIIQVGGK